MPAHSSTLASLLSLTASERAALLATLPPETAAALLYDWTLWARPCTGPDPRDGTYGGQLPPTDRDWRLWLFMGGRGAGKTRAGAEWVRGEVESGRRGRLALIGPTAADVRDVMVEGESGIRACSPDRYRPDYQPTRRRLYWPHNGATAMLYSAEEPDRLRGPQHDGGWLDEVAAWAYPATLDMFLLGLRLGPDPRAVLTTTPRPVRVIRDLLASPTTCVVTRGSTYENASNLPDAFLEQIISRYAGTRIGRQELYAEVIGDTEGALWSRERLDALRVVRLPAAAEPLRRVVVAVDPEAASGEGSAETGIIVAALGADGHGYVLDDRSVRGTPDQWGRAAVTAYHTWHADRLCAETNNGGEMIQHVIHTIDPAVAYKTLHASRGKIARAEPVAALAEQGRLHHVGFFAELEDQLCGWAGAGSGPSPDRLDALVWAFTELMLGASGEIAVAATRTHLTPFERAQEDRAVLADQLRTRRAALASATDDTDEDVLLLAAAAAAAAAEHGDDAANAALPPWVTPDAATATDEARAARIRSEAQIASAMRDIAARFGAPGGTSGGGSNRW